MFENNLLLAKKLIQKQLTESSAFYFMFALEEVLCLCVFLQVSWQI